MSDDFLSVTEAARRLNLNEKTVRRWIASGNGRLPGAWRDEDSGEYRIPASAVASDLSAQLGQDRDPSATEPDADEYTVGDEGLLFRAVRSETTLTVLLQLAGAKLDPEAFALAAEAILSSWASWRPGPRAIRP